MKPAYCTSWIAAGTTVAALSVAVPWAQAAPSPQERAVHRATLDQYCVDCHNFSDWAGGLELETLDTDDLEKDGIVWEKILRKLRSREMPPDLPRPAPETYDELIAFIEGERDRVMAVNPNPGRPTLRRLNRVEYGNAVRDLLALEIDGGELLPADDVGYGFDNIGDVLSVSPLLLERYLSAASRISRLAVGDAAMPAQFQTYDIPRGLNQSDRMDESMPFGSRGGSAVRHYFPVDGEYLIAVKLQIGRSQQILGLERERKLDIRLDGDLLGRFTIAAAPRAGAVMHGAGADPEDSHLQARVPVKAGTHTITATFLKDTVVPEGIVARSRDTAYFEGVGSIRVAGPYDVQGPGDTPSREKIFVCRPAQATENQACAERIISTLARRAYRRPVNDQDVPQLMKLYNQGAEQGGFEAGIRLALQKILVAPEFLFLVELDPQGAEPGSVHQVSDLELASRLALFLWSSIPDDELLQLAERGELKNEAVLESQVMRMLADPRSAALVSNFAGQWLFLRNLEHIQPDPAAFPNFDDNLRDALRKETELVIGSMLREDRNVADILDADYTFINERLAEHYGIEGVYGSEFRRVQVEDEARRGLLGQASILAVTSYPNRTAPTIRGKWVLEQLLGIPPPPPPPNVPSLGDDDSTRTMTMRERMEQHSANPTCAVCHRLMDPLGFALENFDGLGRWRDSIGGSPIDMAGMLPDGTRFNGPAGLRNVLLARKDLFIETFTERLLTYALGRGTEADDKPVIRKIVRDAAADDHRWSSIILNIVRSTPFQMRSMSDGNL